MSLVLETYLIILQDGTIISYDINVPVVDVIEANITLVPSKTSFNFRNGTRVVVDVPEVGGETYWMTHWIMEIERINCDEFNACYSIEISSLNDNVKSDFFQSTTINTGILNVEARDASGEKHDLYWILDEIVC